MNYRPYLLALLLVVFGLMFLGRRTEVKTQLPPDRSASQPTATPENSSALLPATPPPEHPAYPPATAATPNKLANPLRPPPGPVVLPLTAATDRAANTNVASATAITVAVPDSSITPPPTPVMPLPVELGRTDAPVVPPGRDRPYSDP